MCLFIFWTKWIKCTHNEKYTVRLKEYILIHKVKWKILLLCNEISQPSQPIVEIERETHVGKVFALKHAFELWTTNYNYSISSLSSTIFIASLLQIFAITIYFSKTIQSKSFWNFSIRLKTKEKTFWFECILRISTTVTEIKKRLKYLWDKEVLVKSFWLCIFK